MKLLLIFVLFSTLAFGQDHEYVILDLRDAKDARQAYDAMKKAEAEWENIQTRMQYKYFRDCIAWTYKDKGKKECSQYTRDQYKGEFLKRIDSWPDGFEFSKDFKLLLPKPPLPPKPSPGQFIISN